MANEKREAKIEGNIQCLNSDKFLALLLLHATELAFRDIEQLDTLDDNVGMLLSEDAQKVLW